MTGWGTDGPAPDSAAPDGPAPNSAAPDSAAPVDTAPIDAVPVEVMRELVPVIRQSGAQLPKAIEGPLDAALGVAATVAVPMAKVGASAVRAAAPVVRGIWGLVVDPPFVPAEWKPAAVAERFAERGREVRGSATSDASIVAGQALDAIVPTVLDQVLDRVDLTSLVIDVVDLKVIVMAALDSMDLTELVLDRVDLARIVEAAIDSMDLTELVRTKVDLASLAEQVIDDVNLPEIIRDSTADVATVMVDGTRMSAVSADELVNRWVDRILLRRRARQTQIQTQVPAQDRAQGRSQGRAAAAADEAASPGLTADPDGSADHE